MMELETFVETFTNGEKEKVGARSQLGVSTKSLGHAQLYFIHYCHENDCVKNLHCLRLRITYVGRRMIDNKQIERNGTAEFNEKLRPEFDSTFMLIQKVEGKLHAASLARVTIFH